MNKRILLTICLIAIYSIQSSIAQSNSRPFSWDNATVYFVLTDRFNDANPSNNNSYGRGKDGFGNDYNDPLQQVGYFQGGDLQGLTQKIQDGYFDDLGVNAIWITAPYEQIHGWVSGGSGGDFMHYAFHGYYTLDWSEVDANMGTYQDLQAFVDSAHAHDIRVVMDIVMNHVGYNTAKDMEEFGFGAIDPAWRGWRPTGGQTWTSIHDFIDYTSNNWSNWWAQDWARAGLPHHASPGGSDLTLTLAGLPDVLTENTSNNVGLPPILLNKWDAAKEAQENAELNTFFGRTGYARTPRYYIIKWLTDWVKELGIDGYRVDTGKHVEKDAWCDLKNEAVYSLQQWKINNPGKGFTNDVDGGDFWMTGEIWGHGANKSDYHTDGCFNSVINFNFQGLASEPNNLESAYSGLAASINSDPTWNSLHYISSHDTDLFPRGDLYDGGTSLLLAPGAIQIFYGDETARPKGPQTSDPQQATRSYMNWGSEDQGVLAHWQKLGQFRREHLAVGAGSHTQLSSSPYAFKREYNKNSIYDVIIAVVGANGSTTLNVASSFSDGTELRDAYTGNTAIVSGGQVTFNADAHGVILIETTSPVVAPPVVAIAPSGTGIEYSQNPIQVSMTTDSGNDIYYTTDGSTPTSSSSLYTGPFTVSANGLTSIQAISCDSAGTSCGLASQDYYVGTITGFTVHVKKPTHWGTPYIYYWDVEPNTAPLAPATWPGIAMTDEGNDWYSFQFNGALSANLIFSNNGGDQTIDIYRDRDGWYTIGDNHWENTAPVSILTLDVSQSGVTPHYEATPFALTLTASHANDPNPTIYYTLDGSTPTFSSMSGTSPLSLTIPIDTTHLQAFAYSSIANDTTTVQSHTYIVGATPPSMTVYYWMPDDWTSPYIHYWDVTPAATLVNTNWPGFPMQDMGDGWWSYTLQGAQCANIVFSDNGFPQTYDLARCGDGWYKDGVWYETPPSVSFVMDGILDDAAYLFKSFNSLDLWVAENGLELYLASQPATHQGEDVFIFVSDDPITMQAAPWAKSGMVGEWDAFLANESRNGWAGWIDGGASADAASGRILEGTINLIEEFGGIPDTVWLAIGTYNTDDGGALMQVIPVSNTGADIAHYCPFVIGGVNSYVIDGNLDPNVPIFGNNGPWNLWADWNGTELYLATQDAPTQAGDVFIFLAETPGAMVSPPWMKDGLTAQWDAYMANELTNNYNVWWDVNPSSQAVTETNPTFEGTIRIEEEFGYIPDTVWLMAAIYSTNDNDPLMYQIPAGNGNNNIEAFEYYPFVLNEVEGCGRDVFEPNDDILQSKPLPIGGVNMSGEICDEMDKDWFLFVTPPDNNLVFTLTATDADLDLEVYNVGSQLIDSSTSRTIGTEQIIMNNAQVGGAYYIRVSSPEGQINRGYNLRVQTRSTPFTSGAVVDKDGVVSEAHTVMGMQVYPNPTQGMATIAWHTDSQQPTSIRIFDSMGKLVTHHEMTSELGINKWHWNSQNLPAGVYHIRLQTEFDSYIQKLIVNK